MEFPVFLFVPIASCQSTTEKSLAQCVFFFFFTSSPQVFMHTPSLFFLSLANPTSLSLSLDVRCSNSLVIFAALCWIHSNKQTTRCSFNLVGCSDLWSFRVSEKIKSILSLPRCAVCWPPAFPSLGNTHSLPAHISCRQVVWCLLPRWGAPQLLGCILPQSGSGPVVSPGQLLQWLLGPVPCGSAPPLSKCLLFWEELLALCGVPCCWLAAVQTAVSGCLRCAVRAVLWAGPFHNVRGSTVTWNPGFNFF